MNSYLTNRDFWGYRQKNVNVFFPFNLKFQYIFFWNEWLTISWVIFLYKRHVYFSSSHLYPEPEKMIYHFSIFRRKKFNSIQCHWYECINLKWELIKFKILQRHYLLLEMNKFLWLTTQRYIKQFTRGYYFPLRASLMAESNGNFWWYRPLKSSKSIDHNIIPPSLLVKAYFAYNRPFSLCQSVMNIMILFNLI